jgi:hypothetical protein
MCDSSTAVPVGPPRARTLPADRQSREAPEGEANPEADSFALAACVALEAWGGIFDEKDRPLLGTQGRFYSKLEKAMVLAMQHLSTSQRSADRRATVSSKVVVQQR